MEMEDPMDTMDNPMDTLTVPCDPDVVYFEFDVLPILKSSCAISGCHDAATAQDDIILESYDDIIETGKIVAFDLDDSELYEVITETDPDKRMPPEPNQPLNSSQIEVISKWILQGAENLTCDPEENCDTMDISFSEIIFPVIQNNCVGCHSGGNPAGGITLNTYDAIRPVAVSGLLSAVINWAPGVPNMPQGGNQLDECFREQVATWVEEGALNN